MEFSQEWYIPKFIFHKDPVDAENFQPTMCPHCNSALQLYQIQFDEMFLMCGNVDCAYPFGITDFHFFKTECNEEVIRGGSSATSGSVTSYTDWSDVEQIIHTTAYSPASTPPRSLIEEPEDMEKLAKVKEAIQKEKELRKNAKIIKELNKQLFEANNEIEMENEKWIKQIAQMQERSGVKVLKKQEMDKIKPVVPKINASDLKIDVDMTQNTISLKFGNDDGKDEQDVMME